MTGQTAAQTAAREREILRLIEAGLARDGYAPSIDELARSVQIGKSTVFYYLGLLEKHGHIKRVPHVQRGLQLCHRQSPAEALVQRLERKAQFCQDVAAGGDDALLTEYTRGWRDAALFARSYADGKEE
jgi:SOS-response transcriptional repressor LexA